jgi:hypothetical protein
MGSATREEAEKTAWGSSREECWRRSPWWRLAIAQPIAPMPGGWCGGLGVGQMLESIDLFCRDGQRRIAAMLERNFVASRLCTRHRHINLFHARARADHHFNRLATAMSNPDFQRAAQSEPQRCAKAQEQGEAEGLGVLNHF